MMMNKRLRTVAVISLLSVSIPAMAQIPAFPGAEGFGAYATGGRGGDVYTVTSLNNSGSGTLREALDTVPPGGRTIVFAVSGYIPVVSDTNFQVPDNVTIAGQTAPGDGIGLKGGRMLINGNNTIMRHFRIRHGKYGTGGDCLNIASGKNNTMIDHVSFMFSTDENFSFFGGYPNNFTMQYSTSSWGMERHNAGGLWDLDSGTCHHTLWAHHRTRNPKARPSGLLEWINNVTYHWRSEGFIMGDSQTSTDWYANVIGCYYVSIDDWDFGTDSTPFSKARIADNGYPNFHLFLTNTLIDANANGVLDGTDNGYGIVSGVPYPTGGSTPGTLSYYQSSVPFAGAPEAVTIDDPLTAYKKVISSSGPLRLNAKYTGPLRDELDTLLINSVTNQESILVAKDSPVTADPEEPPSNGEQHLADAYGISNNGFGTLNSTAYPADGDGDGMPDFWESTLGWNAAAQDHNTAMPSSGGYLTGLSFFPANTPAGYTRLEEYLHFKAIPHASIAANGTLDVDLRRYTDGFSVAPVFTVSNAVNGTAVILGDGYTARFTPDTDFAGRCRFDFTVTDGEGSTWTQTFAVLSSFAFLPPAAPSDLNATAVSSYQIDLDWLDNANNESGFKIERSTDGVSFGQIDIVPADTSSYSDVPLSPGAIYYYRVRSYNEHADSGYASVASDTTPAGPPAPPAGLSASPGSEQVSLSWDASPGAGSYVVKRATTSGGPYTSIATNTSPGYVDPGLINLTTYYYVVSALNAYGESNDSGPVSATPRMHLRINSGGPAVSPYTADAYYSGGGTYQRVNGINTGGVLDPAPDAVYTTERNGNFSYIITGLVPDSYYLLRLHFAEIFHSGSGLRIFDVFINGVQVLDDLDIYAEAGLNNAMVREFTVSADASGQIEIEYVTVVDNAKSSGIEVLNASAPEPVVPLAYYRFEEGSAGLDVSTVGNPVVDSEGGDDNLNVVSASYAPTYSSDVATSSVPQTAQANNLSLSFDGDDYLRELVDGPLKTDVIGDVTVEAFVRVTDLSGWQTFVGRNDDGGSTNGQDGNPQALFYLSKSGLNNAVRVELSNASGNMISVDSSFIMSPGVWYHIAAVGDVDAGTLTLYVDGVGVGSTLGFNGLFNPASDNPWTIGRGQYAGSPADYVAGSIDEVRISASALSPLQFLNVFSSDSDGDGLNDAWELEHFGNLDQSGTDDPDGDGEDNETEETNGTNPTISSLPPSIGLVTTNGMLNLSWSSNHTGWRLMYNTNLMSNVWTEVSGSDETNGYEAVLDAFAPDGLFFRLEYP